MFAYKIELYAGMCWCFNINPMRYKCFRGEGIKLPEVFSSMSVLALARSRKVSINLISQDKH